VKSSQSKNKIISLVLLVLFWIVTYNLFKWDTPSQSVIKVETTSVALTEDQLQKKSEELKLNREPKVNIPTHHSDNEKP
jgi:hypothetical protein